MEQLLHFLLTYQRYVFLATFAFLALVATVNFVYNPYAKQNCKLKRFNKRTLQKPSCIVLQLKTLPQEYQRQWRAFVNSRCDKPSTVFEFVKLRKRYLLWFVHFLCAATSIVYLVVAIILKDAHVFTTQVAFLLSSILVILINNLIGQVKLAVARRVFGKFLHDLSTITSLLKGTNSPSKQTLLHSSADKTTPISTEQAVVSTIDIANTNPTVTQMPVLQEITNENTTTKPIIASQEIANKTPQAQPVAHPCEPAISSPQGDDVIQKTVQILKQKGLDNPRTAEEQRRLNVALNNLLQACCKHKAQI